MKRRTFNTKLFQVTAGGFATGVTFVPAPKANPYQNPMYIGELASRTADLRNELGGNLILPRILDQAKNVRANLEGGGKALHAAASEFFRRAGYVAYDADRLDLAMDFVGTALALGRKAGSSEKQANAYSYLASISLFQGHPERGVLYAQRGLELPDIDDESRGLLFARLGRTLARIHGQERNARKALDRALAFDTLPPLDVADIKGIAGIGLHYANVHEQALASLNDAVNLSESLSPLYQASYLRHRISVALDIKELDLAADLIHELAYVAPLISSVPVDFSVKEILHKSARWTNVPEIRSARSVLYAVLYQGKRQT